MPTYLSVSILLVTISLTIYLYLPTYLSVHCSACLPFCKCTTSTYLFPSLYAYTYLLTCLYTNSLVITLCFPGLLQSLDGQTKQDRTTVKHCGKQLNKQSGMQPTLLYSITHEMDVELSLNRYVSNLQLIILPSYKHNIDPNITSE